MSLAQANPAHTAGGATQRLFHLPKPHGLALAAEQHDIAVAVRDRGAYQHITIIQAECPQTHAALARKIRQRGLLDRAVGCRHENIVPLRILFHRQDTGDALTLLQWQQVDHGPTTRIPAGQWYLENLQPIHLAEVGETQNGGVGAGDQQVLDEVLILDCSGGFTHATAALGLVIRQRLGLGIAPVRNGHHAVFFGDQVFHRQVVLGGGNFGASLIAVFSDDLFQFLAYYQLEALGITQNIKKICDFA